LFEQRFVAQFNPFNDVGQILHGLPVELVEAQLVEQSVEVLKEGGQLLLQGFFVEVDK
jgi:hypothetical protein